VATNTTEVQLGGQTLRLSNLDKVLYPEAGFTKGQVIDYYARIAPVLLPHIFDMPITLKRYPNGVTQDFFYEKNCPKHRPDWMETAAVQTKSKTINYCLVNDEASLVWIANMASLEMHPFLARKQDILKPTKLTFDLDPGPPAGIMQCAAIALLLQEVFATLGLEAFPKTSGSKGMQLEVPLNTEVTYAQTKPFAHAIAQLMEARHPQLAVSRMEKAIRPGKVLIDWSQNDDAKTTVSAYSLRAKEAPTVSTPVTWDEVNECAQGSSLSFTSDDVLARVEQHGDIQRPVLELHQELPVLPAL